MVALILLSVALTLYGRAVRRQSMKMNRSQFVTGSAQVLELVCPERILRWAITACRRDKLMVLARNSAERAPSVTPAEYRSRSV
jgi:hypothetical protein